MSRYFLALSLCVLSCRDVIPFEDVTRIEGYQLNGTVTTANGIPIESADVLLTYNYDFVSSSPVDTQQVTVTKSLSLVDVAVYTPAYDFVRQLYFDNRMTGPVPHFYWNGRDRLNNLVPSGKYLIRYVVDTTIVKYVPWIVEGHLTASTDASGRFTISDNHLPVNNVFDIYDNTNTYLGTYKVMPSVNLRFNKLTSTSTYDDVSLVANFITSRTFILQ